MRVLVVGGDGYIGTSLSKIIDCDIVDITRGVDISKVGGKDYDVVVDLAALRLKESEANPAEAMRVNYEEAIRLSNSSRHFIFASTCSNYGTSTGFATEDSPLSPTSVYARSKVMAEQELVKNATILRFATAYGVNEKTRHDLILHDFINSAKKAGRIELFGAEFYRPICHVEDIAQAIKLAINYQPCGTYNVGSTDQNYTKFELARMVQDQIPCEVELKSGALDPRNYRVSFEKVKELGFKTKHTPAETIKELAS